MVLKGDYFVDPAGAQFRLWPAGGARGPQVAAVLLMKSLPWNRQQCVAMLNGLQCLATRREATRKTRTEHRMNSSSRLCFWLPRGRWRLGCTTTHGTRCAKCSCIPSLGMSPGGLLLSSTTSGERVSDLWDVPGMLNIKARPEKERGKGLHHLVHRGPIKPQLQGPLKHPNINRTLVSLMSLKTARKNLLTLMVRTITWVHRKIQATWVHRNVVALIFHETSSNGLITETIKSL